MALHKIYTSRSIRACTFVGHGFTLIEVLVVLAIMGILLGVTLSVDVNAYRGNAFHGERKTLVVALQTARAQALNNINQSKHGVKVQPSGYDGYIIFEGESFATAPLSRQERIPTSYPVILEAYSPTEIVFTPLSGDANYDGEIVLRDAERGATTSIVINYEGKIGW